MLSSSHSFRPLSLLSCVLSLLVVTSLVVAQSDVRRETVAITYPLDQSVRVNFRGTTRLPRLSGEARVERTGRRGTRVELSIRNLPRAYELGSIYTTFVLWAISPEGRADNLGEIKRSGSMLPFVNSRLDATTPLQTFALIVTAEPHFLVRGPSRMVILENLPPQNPGAANITTVSVRYLGNTSDYFSTQNVPEVADRDFVNTPTSLLGARQAINLARYVGAERDAQNELREAMEQLEQAEHAWRLRQSEAEVDALARRAISLGARAEELAEERRAARLRREEIAMRDAAIRDAERSAASSEEVIAQLRAALSREERARELAERDSVNLTQQLRDARAEITRLREELQQVRADSEEARLRLARIEGERAAAAAQQESEQRAAQQRQSAAELRQALARFGTVRETPRGLVLVIPDNIWANARNAQLSPRAGATLEPLAALLANHPDYQIVIETHTDGQGNANTLMQLTETRAATLFERLVSAGLDANRVQATGLGASRPLAPNTTANGRARNRRTEINLVAGGAQQSAVN